MFQPGYWRLFAFGAIWAKSGWNFLGPNWAELVPMGPNRSNSTGRIAPERPEWTRMIWPQKSAESTKLSEESRGRSARESRELTRMIWAERGDLTGENRGNRGMKRPPLRFPLLQRRRGRLPARRVADANDLAAKRHRSA